MNILILGSGGREHALAWAVSENPVCTKLFCAPGNAGISKIADCININIMNKLEVLNLCYDKSIDFVIIGPEEPLSYGLSDTLRENDILTFGPSQEASQLEFSKKFTKELCTRANIPTAAYMHFSEAASALKYLNHVQLPAVIKADGLAAGKGVVIAHSKNEAVQAVEDMLNGQFGDAGSSVLIEEFLEGEEVSFFVLCDGKNVFPIGSAKDYKRAYDDDKGPNTGGMGAFSPVPLFTNKIQDLTLETIIEPTLRELKQNGCTYKGVLYAGLMIKNGLPHLIEYNVRFGDPECQVLVARLGAQILDLLLDCSEERLDKAKVNWSEDHSITVVMASNGYPKNYLTGSEIFNIEKVSAMDGIEVFEAGTAKNGKKVVANGGRVLNITSSAENLKVAHEKVYNAVKLIDWKDGFYRTDIGKNIS